MNQIKTLKVLETPQVNDLKPSVNGNKIYKILSEICTINISIVQYSDYLTFLYKILQSYILYNIKTLLWNIANFLFLETVYYLIIV